MHEFGWLYIGVAASRLNWTKVGITYALNPWARFFNTTHAPDYMPFRAYQVPSSDLRKLEKYMHKRLGDFGRINHARNDTPSEWFSCTPNQAAWIIQNELGRCFSFPSNDEGFDIKHIVKVPYIGEMAEFFPGIWEYPEYLALFIDSDGNLIPTQTFMKWHEY